MDIGKKIQSLRLQYGLTQKELADRAELSKGFISQLERNQTSPSIATLTDILECLGTTPGEFFSDRGEEKIVFSSDDMFSIWSSSSRMINPEMLPQPAALTSMAIRRCSLPSIYAVFHANQVHNSPVVVIHVIV